VDQRWATCQVGKRRRAFPTRALACRCCFLPFPTQALRALCLREQLPIRFLGRSWDSTVSTRHCNNFARFAFRLFVGLYCIDSSLHGYIEQSPSTISMSNPGDNGAPVDSVNRPAFGYILNFLCVCLLFKFYLSFNLNTCTCLALT
jgi:hypothetical protein